MTDSPTTNKADCHWWVPISRLTCWVNNFTIVTRRSDLINKHIKEALLFRFIQFDSIQIQFNSIQDSSHFHSCFNVVFMIEIYLFLGSNVLWELNNSATLIQKLDPHTTTIIFYYVPLLTRFEITNDSL